MSCVEISASQGPGGVTGATTVLSQTGPVVPDFDQLSLHLSLLTYFLASGTHLQSLLMQNPFPEARAP